MNWVELAIGGVGLGVLIVGTYALSRLTGVILRRIDLSAQRTKVVAIYSRLAVIAVGVVASVVLYTRYPLLEPIVLVLESEIGVPLVRGLVHGIGIGIVALATVYAAHRGLTPTVKAVLDQRHAVESHRRRRLWLAHAMLIVGYPALGLPLIGAGFGELWLVGFTVALASIWLYVRFPLVSFAYRTRDPTAAERTRIERCFDRFDRRPPKVVVFDDADEDPDVRLDGHGTDRCLWLNEFVLSDADDDELAVILAEEAEKNRGYYYEYARGALVAIVTAGVAGFVALDGLLSLGLFGWGTPSAWTGAFVGGLVVFFGCNWAARRVIRRADDAICTRLDPDLVRHSYDRFEPVISVVDPDAWDDISRRSAGDIPVERRIRRIERTHSLEELEGRREAPDVTDGAKSSTGERTDEQPSVSHESRHYPDPKQGLVAMEPAAFARLVADLRATWGRTCTVADSRGASWIDVRARTDDGTRELLRTVHRASPDPVTRRDIGADEGRPGPSDVDSVIVVTNGRFTDSVRDLETAADVTLIDGPRLVALLEEADLEETRSSTPIEET